MSQNTTNQSDDQEIDLGLLIKKVNGFFDGVASSIFRNILFFKANLVRISILAAIGIGAGVYLDETNKSYNSEIIVTPNIGGTDYLYSKIDFLSAKLKEKDTVFFKNLGIKNLSDIKTIKIEPILDIYSFVNNSTSAANAENTQNFELVKLLAEDGSLKDVIKDKLTSKNYPNHKIQIATSEIISKEGLINPIMKFLNTDEYYNKILKISIESVKIKMKKDEQEIVQIDSILRFMTYNLGKNKNQNLIYNNENNQINPLFDLKNSLINDIAGHKINLENLKLFIRDTSTITNVLNTKLLNNKLKFFLPLFLIFGFIFINLFLKFYKKQSLKALQNKA
jgi:hypothetical protein